MIKAWLAFMVLIGLNLIPLRMYAQEEEPKTEESAEVFLEEYSDEFQENFFEALKQKGIENYDKAINLLLKCKRLDPENSTVDHELAKAYFRNKEYIKAQEYGIEALLSEPENLWYLNTLDEILQKQGGSIENIGAKIPLENNKLKENMVLIYFRQKNYEAALTLLKDLKASSFKEELTFKINDSLQYLEVQSPVEPKTVPDENTGSVIDDLKSKINGFMGANSIDSLEELSNVALETYPSQPYFYYALGYALNRKSKHKEAVEVLETALDYLVDDVPLANNIYQELADGYKALNNISKSNTYLRRIKPGF